MSQVVPPRAGVLVADDEPLIRWALTYALESAGFEVTPASTRDEACDLLNARHFEVIVMADALGGESVVDVLEMLSRFHNGSGLVVLDGGDDPENFCAALPHAVVVAKPFGLEALTAAVEGFSRPQSEAC